jgi:cellulose synthase operon protein YhjU
VIFWEFYFFSKLYFFCKGSISFFLLPNIVLFGTVVLVSAWIEQRGNPKKAVIAFWILSPILALAVLWQDTFWPPFLRSLSFVASPATRPTPSYMLSFLAGYWDPHSAIVLALILAAVIAITKFKFKMTLVLAIGILIAGGKTLQARAPASVDEEVARFYSRQAEPASRVTFVAPPKDAPPFDIVFLHTCSMSWDDLKRSGLDQDPFFSKFDVLFTRFNTVTSYSGPSLLRLLRANCGQVEHSKLYENGHEECSLLSSLSRLGYKTYTIFNHEGPTSDQMAHEAVTLAGAASERKPEDAQVEYVSYDGSQVYGNLDLLSRWWKHRLSSSEERAVLYYDSMSLHVGVHDKKDDAIWKSETLARYKQAVPKAFSDYTHFMDLIEASGRPVLVVLVAEHGAALFGNRIQGSDLREIPLPQITTVPVGFRFIHGKSDATKTVKVGAPLSYTAIAYLIREALRARNPADVHDAWEGSLSNIPKTEPFISENANYRVAAYGGELYLKRGDESWIRLDHDLYPEWAVSRSQ